MWMDSQQATLKRLIGLHRHVDTLLMAPNGLFERLQFAIDVWASNKVHFLEAVLPASYAFLKFQSITGSHWDSLFLTSGRTADCNAET